MIYKFFDIYAGQKVKDFIKEKRYEWDFVMTFTEMNNEHCCFGGGYGIFLISMINKMQIIVVKNDLKNLIVGTENDKLYSFLGYGDPPARVHPPCHLYLLSYYCLTNPSFTNMFNHIMYVAVKGTSKNPE